MDLNSQVDYMDEELKLLQSEIKQVLLEIQEGVLEVQNPFSGAAVHAPQPPRIQQSAPNAAAPSAPQIAYIPTMDAAQPGLGESVPPSQPDQGYGASETSPTTNTADMKEGFAPDFPSEEFGGGHAQDGSGSRQRTSSSRNRSPRPSSGQNSPAGASIEGSAERKQDAAKVSEPPAENDVSRVPGLPPASESQKEHKPTEEASYGKDKSFNPPNTKPGESPREKSEESPLGSMPAFQLTALEGKLKHGSMDLVTIAGLAQWTSSALRKVGREHLASLLQITALTGRISRETMDVLLAFIPLLEASDPNGEISAKEIVSLFAQLDGFLGTVSKTDTRLLPFLLQDDLDVFPLIQP